MHFVCTAHAPHVHGISTRLAHQAAALLRHGWLQLLYLSVAVTATANLLQAYGQQRVGAAEAAIIYTMDPVYGALFAWLLLGERLHTQGPYICTRTHTQTHTDTRTQTQTHTHIKLGHLFDQPHHLLLPRAGYVGIVLVLSANVLRRLPWSVVAATRRLLTPHQPTRRGVPGLSVATTSDTRCEPLLPKCDTKEREGPKDRVELEGG